MITSMLMNIFEPTTSNLFFVVGISGASGLFIGFLFKAVLLAKYKKRVLALEDDMLANHSRILEQEKLIATLKEEKARLQVNGNGLSKPKSELKVS